jgi:hypothetical protein
MTVLFLQRTSRFGYYSAMPEGEEEFMTQEKIIEAIRSKAVDNRLSCEKAHELSVTLHVPLREIGVLCNQLNIKISACQLGCF